MLSAVDTEAEELLSKPSASVTLPAGCGKTQLIGSMGALAERQGKRLLVLTHTNAGVQVIRDRLARFGVDPKSVTVRTIDSWCRYLAQQFPRIANVTLDADRLYQATVDGAARVLAHWNILSLVRATFDHVVVDEYQDTSVSQHAVVLAMKSVLPVTVLGDPLQGIYGWPGNPVVDWSADVVSNFNVVQVDVNPWRWRGYNEVLGASLLGFRESLRMGRAIDLSATPGVNWRQNDPRQQVSECIWVMSSEGSVVALHSHAQQCYSLGRQLGGKYGVMEELECVIVKKLAESLDRRIGSVSACELLKFARQCASGYVKPLDGAQVDSLSGGVKPRARGGKAAKAANALAAIIEDPVASNLSLALGELRNVAGVKVFRREAWREAMAMLELARRNPRETFAECAISARSRSRRLGRVVEQRVISRTLLVKGLEYDTGIVLDADSMNARNLYVALTRARRKLIVFSRTPILNPVSF
ncbi:UvrD-helicase domain-containing protein [Amycolatopsis heterodermiae]|uniref:UvrD-helicase domain-containing protein n=1 Tax=Amycolatopsis heterodermiae TaxID=3110235 RepID=UPI00396A1435